MKINIFILLLIFRIFLFETYHYPLKDGIEKNITHTSYNNYNYYVFYISPKITTKHVKFTVKIPNGCKLKNDLDIYEYDSWDSPDKFFFPKIEGKMINNICIYYYSYNISSSISSYVGFKTGVRENSGFEKNIVTFRIDLVDEEYDLYNRHPLDIFNLYVNNSYYLYLGIFETINISFIINNMTQEPFSDINIHELAERDYLRINITNRPIAFTTSNNQSIASFSYSTNSNYTKYIVLHIKPSLKISKMTAEFKYSVTSIELNNDIWKTIDNLISNEIYLFFIEATETSKVNLKIIINNTSNEFDEYELPIILNNGTIIKPSTKDIIPYYIDINIYEYEKKNNSYISFFGKNSKRLSRLGTNYFMSPFPYKINSSNTSYFAFSYKPNYNINHMQVNISLSGGLFDLFNNTPKNMSKIRADNDYYFFIKSQRFYFLRLTFEIKDYLNLTNSSFLYINSSQLSERQNYKSNEKHG